MDLSPGIIAVPFKGFAREDVADFKAALCCVMRLVLKGLGLTDKACVHGFYLSKTDKLPL